MRKVFRASVLLLSGFLLMGLGRASAQMSSPQGPQPITPAMEQKVDAMVQKLTLEQKIALIGGEDSMYIRSRTEHWISAAENVGWPVRGAHLGTFDGVCGGHRSGGELGSCAGGKGGRRIG